MKRSILLLVGIALLAAGVFWIVNQRRPDKDQNTTEKKVKSEGSETTKIARDTNNNVQITLAAQSLRNLRIAVRKLEGAQMRPQLKGYGRVLDPAPLAGLILEQATAKATYVVSSNELARLKTLENQGNASARALQSAEAAALRDQLAVQSVNNRLLLSWGKAIAAKSDLEVLCRQLTDLEVVLVRIDLPAGERLSAPPIGARLSSLSGDSWHAEFLGTAATVDPQTQGQGFLFLAHPGNSLLSPGEAVAGSLEIQAQPIAGLTIPREAVVPTEGAGWIYVQQLDGESFTRRSIDLTRPTESGWFITQGATTNDRVVVNGAQLLLSIESKGNAEE